MRYRLSKAAAQDLEDIYLYGILQLGETQADRYIDGMRERLELICLNPQLGRIDSNTNPAIRRCEYASHVIFYDILPAHLLVVRILHGAADYLQHL